MRRSGAFVACVLSVVLLSLAGGTPVSAAANGEGYVTSYEVGLHIRANGVVDVRERIDYAFDGTGHGIERFIPVRYRYDESSDRVIELGDVAVTSSTLAPVDLLQENHDGHVYLRIGDPDREVGGTHSYEIRYAVTGALNAFADHDELSWNAIGDRWSTSISEAFVTVRAPEIQRVECFYGEAGSNQSCSAEVFDGVTDGFAREAHFGPVALYANEGMTVVVELPQGLVAVPAPILVERWSAARAFSFTPLTVSLSILLLVLGAAGVLLARRRGRDEAAASRVAGLPTLTSGEESEPVDWRAVQEMRPGLVGTLVDERADVVDITATIVDLAVRRHLRIEELPPGKRSGPSDWQLVRLDQPPDDLLPYEQKLLADLFHAAPSVRLRDLRETFHEQLQELRGELYDEVVSRGWYRNRPDRTRNTWYGAAAVAVVLTAGIAVLLAAFTSYGLVGVALVVPALGLLVAARAMPVRTSQGSAAVRQVLALRRYLETAQAQQLRWEDSQRVFSQLMPYAMVFGQAQEWTAALRSTAVASGTGEFVPEWYDGTPGSDVADFGSSVSSFAAAAGSAMSATPPDSGSSGGGVSSGGGGGGGGGW